MDGVYSGCADIAKLNRIQCGADFLQLRQADVLPDAANGKMRREGAFFLFITQTGCACFNAFLQGSQILPGRGSRSIICGACAGLGMSRVRPVADQTAGVNSLHEQAFVSENPGVRWRIPKEFQGQMHVLGGNPADNIIPQCLAQAGCLFLNCFTNMFLGSSMAMKARRRLMRCGLCLL